MPPDPLAREITYAGSARTAAGRAVVRLLEAAGGRGGLLRRARGYRAEVDAGGDFWGVICARYGVGLRIVRGTLDAIPARGPVVVVANHPFGILDGLILGRILSDRRGGDFRILAHSVFDRAPELARALLPVDFAETPEARRANLAMRAGALAYLADGGAIGVFPGGTVSTAATPFGPALDPVWRSFTAKLVARADVTVVPLFFEGANPRLFQLASHLHCTLRLGLLIPAFRARIDAPVRVAVGDPVPRAAIAGFGRDARGLMAHLRAATYALSDRPAPPWLGLELEPRYRDERRARLRADLPAEAARGL